MKVVKKSEIDSRERRKDDRMIKWEEVVKKGNASSRFVFLI